MASVADIFGPTPEELEYKRRQEEEQLARQDYRDRLASAGSGLGRYADLAKSGVRQGEQLRRMRLFGEAPSPEMERATAMQSILKKYQGQNMSNPEVLAQMAGELGQQGYPREAMQLMDQAKSATVGMQEARRKAQLDALAIREKEADIAKKEADALKPKKVGGELSDGVFQDLTETAQNVNTGIDLAESYEDSFGSKPRFYLDAQRVLPNPSEETQRYLTWWSTYDNFVTQVRNKLFGVALSANEEANFERIKIKETDSAATAKRKLAEQAKIAKKGFDELLDMYEGRAPGDVSSLRKSLRSVGGEAAASDGEWTVEVIE